MKKNWGLFILLFGSIFLVACSNNKEDDFSDSNFLTSLASGLNKRWDYVEKNDDSSEESYKKSIVKGTQIELDELSKYSTEKFEDTKLQEKAISYINELKNGSEIIKSYGSDSFYQDWDVHYANRTKLLVDLTDKYDVPLADKHKETFSELKAHGKEVAKNEKTTEIIDNLMKNSEFEIEEDNSGSDYKNYFSVVENTTEFDISSLSATANLLDSDGIIVETAYLSANNWKKGQKYKFTFMTNKQFKKIDMVVEFFEVK